MNVMRAIVVALALSAATLGAAPALAQAGNTAMAEAFFQDGRALYEEGKYEEGCPKLAESHRLDPATGTLLALALCHEGQGKLASAWSEFVEVEGRARREGRADREKLAAERAAALRPRLSTLTVEVTADVAKIPGLAVRVDGVVVGAASYGVAVPVDGGSHRVEAQAPGRAPWQGALEVKAELDAARVAIPELSLAAPETKTKPGAASSSESGGAKKSGKGMRTVGLITAGVGVVALGVGGGLALGAKSDYSKARAKCSGLDCEQGPYDDIQKAQKQGTIATILVAGGGAVFATGAVLWLLSPSEPDEKPRAAGGVRVDRVAVGAQGVLLGGSF
jgi:hypothetical protein